MIPPRRPESKDKVFMTQCHELAKLSKDPNTQIGAMIVDSKNRIVSQGYNGPPPLIPDMLIDWSSPNKYPFVCHAEDNALYFATAARGIDGLRDCRLYVTGIPCSKCMIMIVRAEIRVVIYDNIMPNVCAGELEVIKQIAKLANITLLEYKHDCSLHT